MSFTGSGPLVPPPAKWTSDAASLVATHNAAPLYLEAVHAGIGNPSNESKSRNRERAWRRMLREEGAAVREMHIGARIESKEEVLLLTLRYHVNTGLLRSTPGFSAPIGDAESDPDRAVKGSALSTYQFVSDSGARYEVALDNVSDLQPLESAEHERVTRKLTLREQRDDAAAVERWQQQSQKPAPSRALVNHQAERDRGKRMVVMCEVVSVKNSRSKDPIEVEYALIVENSRRRGRAQWRVVEDSKSSPATPRGKRAGSHSSRPRRTPLCAPRLSLGSDRGGSTAAFGSHDTFHVLRSTQERDTNESGAGNDEDGGEEECLGRLNLQFGVYSRDSWGRKRREAFGQLQVPTSPEFHDCEVPLWKPVLSIREQLEEQFLGMDETEAYRYPTPRAGRSETSSMWGATCESTDMTLRVRLNVAVSGVTTGAALHLEESTSSVLEGLANIGTQAAPGSRVVKRSVQEILQSVRLEKRLGGTLSSVVDRAVASKEQADRERQSLV